MKFLLCNRNDEGEDNSFFQSDFEDLLKKISAYLADFLYEDCESYEDCKYIFEIHDGAGSAELLAEFLAETGGTVETSHSNDFDYCILI